MFEDRRFRIILALVGGAVVTLLSQSYVYFDWHWSTVANVVIFVLASLLTYYAVVSLSN